MCVREDQKHVIRSCWENEDSIMCDGCERWFHPKCQSLSTDAFRALSKYDFAFLCLECRPKLKDVMKLGKQLEARIEETEKKLMAAIEKINPRDSDDARLDEKIACMEDTVIKKIQQHQVNVEESLKEQQATVRAMPGFTEELKSRAQELKDLLKAKEEKISRESNILLHNIPESTSDDPENRKRYDQDSFYNVAAALFGESVSMKVDKIFRVGKKSSPGGEHEIVRPKPRLMMVKLREKEAVDMLIKNRMKLKERGFPNVYITHDLPPEEREAQKKLRQEWVMKGKETHVIFRGKVVPRK